jgi:hypothetical protein
MDRRLQFKCSVLTSDDAKRGHNCLSSKVLPLPELGPWTKEQTNVIYRSDVQQKLVFGYSLL